MLLWLFSQVPDLVIGGGVGWADPLALEGDGGGVHHLKIVTRAVVSCPGLFFWCWEAGISDRISAIAGANPTVSGSLRQFSPGEHGHQSC
jgi:hypothetical protein